MNTSICDTLVDAALWRAKHRSEELSGPAETILILLFVSLVGKMVLMITHFAEIGAYGMRAFDRKLSSRTPEQLRNLMEATREEIRRRVPDWEATMAMLDLDGYKSTSSDSGNEQYKAV